MEDRSLDDFLDAGEEPSDDGEDEHSESDEAETADSEAVDEELCEAETNEEGSPAVNPAAVEPAATTSRFAPGGATCEGCGERVTRFWVDDGEQVCRTCKSW